jgi:hypothetical protein
MQSSFDSSRHNIPTELPQIIVMTSMRRIKHPNCKQYRRLDTKKITRVSMEVIEEA